MDAAYLDLPVFLQISSTLKFSLDEFCSEIPKKVIDEFFVKAFLKAGVVQGTDITGKILF
jgi:hypothetical protein